MISNPTTTDQIIDVSPIPDSFYDNICEYYEELIDHPDKYLFNARQWLHWFHHYQNESDTYALKLMRRVIQSGTLYAFRTLQFVVPSCNDDEQILEMIDSNQNSEGIPSVQDSSIFKGKEKHIRKDILINKEELIQSACHVQCYSDQLAAKCIAESLRVKPVFGKTTISIVEGDCLEVAIHVMMKQRTLSLIDSTTTGIINSSSSSAVLNLPTVISPSKNNKTQRKFNSSNTSTQSTTSPLPPFKLALLNMASSKRPGGGYREGAGSQEENLFRRTSLAFSLEDIDSFDSQRAWYYPLEKHGGVYIPNVQVIRGSESKGYPFLNEIFTLHVISVAALRSPKLDHTGTRIDSSLVVDTVRRKIRLIFAMALQHGVTHLVLSAFGCGAYRNPPQHVAQLFKQVLMQEYDGKFSQVIFAIYNDANAMRRGDGGNVEPFEKEFGIKASVFKEQ